MPAGEATVTIVKPPSKADIKIGYADVTVGIYATNGVSITPSQLGFSSIVHVTPTVKSVSGTVNVTDAFYDVSTSKLKCFDETPAEVANAADLSGIVFRCLVVGT